MRTIFLIAPIYPPSSLPPAHRVRLLVSHFRSFGYEPVIFTVDHKYREDASDPWMEELISVDCKVIKVRCLDFRKTRKLGIGDLGLRMAPFLLASVRAEIKKNRPDLILFPVPPWNILVTAPLIKLITRIPYGIDYIDPWIYPLKTRNFKAVASQWIAKAFERWVVNNSSIIFAVSKGILKDLEARYPSTKNKSLVDVPYGVELKDYAGLPERAKKNNSTVIIRYIGAISDESIRVVAVGLEAIKELSETVPLQVEFIGTSYAGVGLAKARLSKLIDKMNIGSVVVEKPDRVAYKTALSLTISSDVLLLFGDMTTYYAASKLMGLIASGRPFLAFIHKESFPARFFRAFNYRYIVDYSSYESDTPEANLNKLTIKMKELLANLDSFNPIDKSNPLFVDQTAYGMTKVFAENIKRIIA